MSRNELVEGLLAVLKEACEGGAPGKGTGFLENTRADGSGNAGLFATLESLTAEQASEPTALGTSVASHASHLLYHLEVGVRWAKGDRGPFDWKGSFEPRVVDAAGWQKMQVRAREAYEAVVLCARSEGWGPDTAETVAAALAHAAYHLGALRQVSKLAR